MWRAFIAGLQTRRLGTDTHDTEGTGLRKPYLRVAPVLNARPRQSEECQPQQASTEALIRSRAMSRCNRNRKAAAVYINTNTKLIPIKGH